MGNIYELEERADAIRQQIGTITTAFGAEYVPEELKNELTMVEASIENARDREAAVAKCEENGRVILGGAFLVDDDGDGKFRHENSDKLCTNHYDMGFIRWSCQSESDGQILAIFVTVRTNRLDDCKSLYRKLFRIDWKAKSFCVDADKMLDIKRFIYALPDGVKEFRMAEFCCTVDAIKRSLNSAGIQPV